MKPTDLVFPFRWADRQPLFVEGVLFIPKYYEGHDKWPKEEWQSAICSSKKIFIEYCAGNGAWIAEKAKEFPDILWIAVEKRFDRVRRIWSKKKNYALSNLLIVCGAAEVFSAFYLQESSVDQVFVNFPDPWPKDRHAKNRLLQKSFVERLEQVIKPRGEVTLVTDDELTSLRMIEEMLRDGAWDASFPEPFYTNTWPGYGTSFFDSLWREKGKDIRYMKFKRCL